MTSYFLYPAASYSVVSTNGGGYALGTEFTVSAPLWLRGIGIYRATAQMTGPITGRLYQVVDAASGAPVAGTDVTFNLNGAGTGWQTAYLANPPQLVPGVTYRVAAYFPNYFSKISNYFTSGPGGSGISSGPLFAPPKSAAVGQQQNSYTAGPSMAYPVTSNADGPSYLVDVILTDVDPNGASQAGTRTPIYGIDISNYQAGLDLSAAQAAGIGFVIAKIGQGAGAAGQTSYGATLDNSWAGFRDSALALGLPLAGYWYLGNTEPVDAQAARCAQAIGNTRIPIMMDWETTGGDITNLTAAVQAFRGAGLTVRMIYTSKSYYDSQGGGDLSALGATLVTSRFPQTVQDTPANLYVPVSTALDTYWQIYGGLTPQILQFASTATIAGQILDADAFNGTAADLATLFALAPTGGSSAGTPPSGPLTTVRATGAGPPVDPQSVSYAYHFTDLRTGAPQGVLPLIGVTDQIALGGAAGALSGLIQVADPDVRALNPWAVCVPRRTALYVRRIEHYPPGIPDRETIDWGGIVWDLNPLAGTGHLEIKAATFESYFARRFLDVDRAYSQIEQTAIHADLLAYFQTYRAGANIRVEATPLPTGVYRDRTYLGSDTKNLLDVLTQLGSVQGGFDWWIQPYRDTTSGRFGQRVAYGYPRIGRQAASAAGPLRLRHLTAGGGNVIGAPTVRRQGSAVVNEMIGLGAQANDTQVRAVVDAEDLGRAEVTAGFPLLQATYSDSNVTDPDVLRANTAAQLVGGWASEVLLTDLVTQGTRRPTRADISLGDDVALYTDDATWPAPVTLLGRIWAIETTRAHAGTSEQVKLTLAGPGLST